MSREALGLEAHRQGLWTEADLGRFLGLTRLALDQFLKDHGVELVYDWEDLERERQVHRDMASCQMLVVADTSPLNYLVWIGLGLAAILPELYGAVVVPAEVRDELLSPAAPPVVRSWTRDLPGWVEIKSPATALRDDPRWAPLDLGERAAIALATVLRPAALLIDERAGSAVARGLSLPVTGTLGVLDEAARRRLISLPDAITRLKGTSFRYPRAVVERLLNEDAQRRCPPKTRRALLARQLLIRNGEARL